MIAIKMKVDNSAIVDAAELVMRALSAAVGFQRHGDELTAIIDWESFDAVVRGDRT